MKTKDFVKIGKQLLPQLPGFAIEKRLVFKAPVDDFLRGLYFESSADAEWFYLSVFILPLFVPNDAVHVTFGKRMGRASNWFADNPNLLEDLTAAILNEALPFLDRVSNRRGVLNYLKDNLDRARPRINSHVLEAYAYTLIRSGDFSSALTSLSVLKGILDGDTTPWAVEQDGRARIIEEKLLQSPAAVAAQLEAWKSESISRIGLEKHR